MSPRDPAHPRIKCGAGSELVEGHERGKCAYSPFPLKWFDRLTMSGQEDVPVGAPHQGPVYSSVSGWNWYQPNQNDM